MTALYLVSEEPAGKTALCVGIAKKLKSEGKKVGFLRPVRFSEAAQTDGYLDTMFIKDVLGLAEPVEMLSPLVLSKEELWHGLAVDKDVLKQRFKDAYEKVSAGKDVVLMEGFSGLRHDKIATETCYQVAEAVGARVVVVLRYSRALAPADLGDVSRRLGQMLLGVIVNYLPSSLFQEISEGLKVAYKNAGIRVLGLLPEARTLLGLDVGELARSLNGQVILNSEDTSAIVENVMIGAISTDPATDYFGRKANKAVVVRSDRADMQLAALKTPTACLILTGNGKPHISLLGEIKQSKIPVITVKSDTQATVAAIEEAFQQARFHSKKKLEKLSPLLEQHLDFPALRQALGLS